MRAYEIKAERGREVTLETPDFLEQARQLLSRSLPVELRMSGSSMSPAIEDGDIITLEPVNDEPIKQGDIVLYHSRFDTAVIHRVIRIERSHPSDASSRVAMRLRTTTRPFRFTESLAESNASSERASESRWSSQNGDFSRRSLAWLHRLKFW